MKRIVLGMIVLVCAGFLQAQVSLFLTGDATFDAQLADLNVSAKADTTGFFAGVSLDFGLPQAQIQLAASSGMQPGEVYIAAGFAQVSKQPMPKIIALWKKHKGKGWGAVAKELNIKPGSKDFKALKDKAAARKGKMKDAVKPDKKKK
jgi:hypothetical protein